MHNSMPHPMMLHFYPKCQPLSHGINLKRVAKDYREPSVNLLWCYGVGEVVVGALHHGYQFVSVDRRIVELLLDGIFRAVSVRRRDVNERLQRDKISNSMLDESSSLITVNGEALGYPVDQRTGNVRLQ